MISTPTSESLEDVIIRPPALADAESAASCHLTCWQEAYRGMITDQVLDDPTALERRTASWTSMITNGRPMLLAVAADDVVGFIAFGPGRDDDLDLEQELGAIYVRQAWWGTGLAQRLLDTIAPEVPDAYVWVLADNARAQSFYAKNGFVPDGASKYLEPFSATEIRMVRASIH